MKGVDASANVQRDRLRFFFLGSGVGEFLVFRPDSQSELPIYALFQSASSSEEV